MRRADYVANVDQSGSEAKAPPIFRLQSELSHLNCKKSINNNNNPSLDIISLYNKQTIWLAKARMTSRPLRLRGSRSERKRRLKNMQSSVSA